MQQLPLLDKHLKVLGFNCCFFGVVVFLCVRQKLKKLESENLVGRLISFIQSYYESGPLLGCIRA